ncbi:MAG: IPT/TIG domain-containing protein, partial [Acidobacteriota bacterium]
AGRGYVLNDGYFNQQTSNITEDIQAFDLGTYSFINSLTIPNLSGSRIVRWGSAGLAVAGGTQIYLIDGTFVSPSSTPPATGPYVGVSPTITALSPQSVIAGSPAVNVIITGKDFTQATNVTWNNYQLPVTYQSPTQVTASFPASMLATAAASSLSLSNGPGTETSNSIPFVVLPNLGPNTQISALGVSGLEMAADPTRGLIYVAVTSPTALYGNSVVAVDPSVPAIKAVIPTAYQPSTLGVSDDGKYLYVGFQTLAAVNRYKLSDLSLDLSIPLNAGPTNSNYAGDVKVAPGQDQTFAVSMGSYVIEPRDAGGLAIYDNATPRTNLRHYGYPDTYKLAWGKDSTSLFAHSDPIFQPQGLLLMSVDASGIGPSPVGGGGVTDIGLRPHYDAGTNLFYSDGGRISDPVSGIALGQFTSGGWMVPDSDLNRAFVLRANTTTTGYSIDIFDLRRQTLLKTIPAPVMTGYPTQILRWGQQGIAILTNGPGMLYLLQGSDISGITSGISGAISLSPANLIVGAASGATITVTGSSFSPTSVVVANGVQQATTYVSSTQLSFQLNAAQASTAGYLGVTVFDSANADSASPATALELDNPAPTITSISATKLLAGSPDTSLAITGAGFLPGTFVRWNGVAVASVYNSATSLSVVIPAIDLASAGTYGVTAVNAAPGGGTTPGIAIEVDNPAPVITALPATILPTGSAPISIGVTGTGFLPTTVIAINGTPVLTTYGSATQLRVTVAASFMAAPGTLSFTATNAAPGGGTSAPATMTVSSSALGAITVSPTVVLQNATPPANLTVTGANFVPGCVVLVGGQSRTTTFISSTQLTANLVSADQATVGTRFVTVVNPMPNGGTSYTA